MLNFTFTLIVSDENRERIAEAREVANRADSDWFAACGTAGEQEAHNASALARNQYFAVVVDATIDAAEDAGYRLLSRAELCAELDVAIRSKLPFGDALLRLVERAQWTGGHLDLTRGFDRWNCQVVDAGGRYRAMSHTAFMRALNVLWRFCLRRVDTGGMCPPYRVEGAIDGLVELRKKIDDHFSG